MNIQTKIIASHLLYGINPEWQDFLCSLLENAKDKDIPIDFEHALSPLPKQLRNPCVLKEYKDGVCEYMSSQIWLAIDQTGKRTIIEPKETSGVLIEGETGRIIKPFSNLPTITPRDTQYLIRILIRKEFNNLTQQLEAKMRWTLYSDLFS